jgi:hypothetical protein
MPLTERGNHVTLTMEPATSLPVNREFARPASRAALARAAEALRARGMEAHVVKDGEAALELVLSLLPEGADVGQGASATLDQIGVTRAIEESGRVESVRIRTRSMDRVTQGHEIRRQMSAPEVQVNSAQAVTEDGRVVMAAGTGNNIAAVTFGAGKVILIVGAQKVMPDLAAAFRRVEEYAYPMEDVRMREVYGAPAALNKILVLQGERPGRITVILVDEVVGV